MPVHEQDDEPVTGAAAAGSVAASGTGLDAITMTDVDAVDRDGVLSRLQQVDDALVGVAELPTGEQVAVFTELHRQLTAALAVTATAAVPVDAPPPTRADDQRRPGILDGSRQPVHTATAPGHRPLPHHGPVPQHRPGPPSQWSR